ncbi:hypothetical protein PI95_008470 [Hassallia byssoidea VB512170]|uniref:Uncharacterized protein n=1 Tax=Hassallia byssoidea VB512170 TaxID=1304833 RepID=A0A846H7J7_9CYAN|nr:hypothetical protein [Hassalia byssoidea]NEU72600.1 hypothetical protein [Hassalia byssoidea VB512170]
MGNGEWVMGNGESSEKGRVSKSAGSGEPEGGVGNGEWGMRRLVCKAIAL